MCQRLVCKDMVMRLCGIICELGVVPDGEFRGRFVKKMPFVGVFLGREVRAVVLAAIEYTWSRVGGVDIGSYDALEVVPLAGAGVGVLPGALWGDAMMAILKRINAGGFDVDALRHFQTVNRTGPRVAEVFRSGGSKRKKKG